MKNFLFIDDHAVVRSSFSKILSEPYNPVNVEEAGNGDEAIEKIKNAFFDLVVMDVQMPNTDTLGLVKFISTYSPDTKILILSMASETVHARRYMMAGANGYVSKTAPLDEVYKAIHMVLQGRKYISETLADSLIGDNLVKDQVENPFQKLSEREYEIVIQLLEGKTVTEISRFLNKANSTISTYKIRLFKKLNVTNLIELKDLASEYKL